MCLTLLTSCFDSCLSVHFVLLTSSTSHSLTSSFKYCMPSFPNKPSRNVNAAPISFFLLCIVWASYFLSSIQTIIEDFLGHYLSCFSDCFEMYFSRILSEPARAETVCCLFGPSLGLPLSWLDALLLPLIRHSVCIHACPCPPSFF